MSLEGSVKAFPGKTNFGQKTLPQNEWRLPTGGPDTKRSREKSVFFACLSFLLAEETSLTVGVDAAVVALSAVPLP